MNIRILLPVTALTLSAGLAGTALAGTAPQPDPAQAKISMQQARAQASDLVQGQIRQAELEREQGGSGLRYSFDIQTAKGPWEVGIDAMTGKVLENGPERDRHEQDAEAEDGHEDQVADRQDDHADGEVDDD